MFDIGFSEMVLLAVIALVAIGPKQLPEVARTVGRMLNELKRATGDLTKTVLDARETTDKVISSTMSHFEDAAKSVNEVAIEPIKHEPFVHHDLPPHPPMLDDHVEVRPREEQLSLLDQPHVTMPDKKES